MNFRNWKYQKGSSPYSYVSKLRKFNGDEIWMAYFKKTKFFKTEKEAALFVDRICIQLGIEPKNILNRVINNNK